MASHHAKSSLAGLMHMAQNVQKQGSPARDHHAMMVANQPTYST
jgi:hypothetical protein